MRKSLLLIVLIAVGTIASAQVNQKEDYPQKQRKLCFKTLNFEAGEVAQGFTTTDTLFFYNAEKKKSITLSTNTLPSFINVAFPSTSLLPLSEGYALITVDASRINESGDLNSGFQIITDEKKKNINPIHVAAKILDRPTFYFSERVEDAAQATRSYPQKLGGLWFKSNYLVFNNIYNTEVKTDTLFFYNSTKKPISLSTMQIPSYIKTQLIPALIQPGYEGALIITFDASAANDWGYKMSRIVLKTNDSVQPNKQITISANITEDFTVLTEEEMQNAPVLSFEKTKHDFGNQKSGKNLSYSFAFTNKGQEDLIIRKTRASCGCTTPTLAKTVIKAGETAYIDIVFNTRGRKGKQHKNVTVISNDPKKPITILQIQTNLSN